MPGEGNGPFFDQDPHDMSHQPFEMVTPGQPFLENISEDYNLDDYNLVEGTNQNDDPLSGTFSSDLILAGNGDDIVVGQPLPSEQDLEEGESPEFPDDDNDVLFGENGDDTLNGVGGNDVVYGNNGDDIVQGGVEDDQLYGNNGDDILYGRFENRPEQPGDPQNYNNSGDDELCGGRGEDLLLPGSGSNILSGGLGEDKYIFEELSGFLRDDGSNVTNTITDLGAGDEIVFSGEYTEPTSATRGDGSLNNAQEVQDWVDSLGDSIYIEDGNLYYDWNADTLKIGGSFDSIDDAVNLLGQATITWTDDFMVS